MLRTLLAMDDTGRATERAEWASAPMMPGHVGSRIADAPTPVLTVRTRSPSRDLLPLGARARPVSMPGPHEQGLELMEAANSAWDDEITEIFGIDPAEEVA